MSRYFIFLLMIFLSFTVSAQYSLTFCENITTDGEPENTSTKFAISHKGGVVKCLLKSDDKLNSEKIFYKIFFITNNGNEKELIYSSQDIQSQWTYAWKEIVLFDQGVYRVKVYNGNGTYLTSANVIVKQL